MGTWAHDSFGNDDACDWAFQLGSSKDLSIVEAAISEVLKVGDEYLEASTAAEGIAAAEAVARLQGHFGVRDAYSEPLDVWVAQVGIRPDADLIARTLTALERIVSRPSELLSLWQEGGEADNWLGEVAELRARVASSGGRAGG